MTPLAHRLSTCNKARNAAVTNDVIRGMRLCDIAEKYGFSRTRAWQLQCLIVHKRYVEMRREQAKMLKDYPRIYAEIMEEE
jgi:hypothetical protein